MASTKYFRWPNSLARVSVTFNGEGNGALTIDSTPNYTSKPRSMDITLKTTDNTVSVNIHITQYSRSSDFNIDFNTDFCL